jgi:hypothetical protein
MTTWHTAAGPPEAPLSRPPATDQEQPAVRKIISFTHATLDGYIDDPHKWSFQYSNEELQAYGLKMTLAADALLLSRITYEGMAQAWPTRGGNQ